ncbi:MAG: DUF928 domain-containing protein [Cyanobacteriota bacterium]|nr:DUF928 domain-containing protein [Cyanobacteriota bacterium]
MTKHKVSSQQFFCLLSSGVFVIGSSLSQPVRAYPTSNELGDTAETPSLLALQFQLPGDPPPPHSVGGGTRGEIKFAAPGERAPRNSGGGASRGEVRFAAPGERAPRNSGGGASRGEIGFRPPGDPTPVNTASGGVRTDAQPQLTALLPDTQHGRTVSARPTFLIRVPPTASREIFFSLQDQERNHVYQTTLKISGNGGIVKFVLPEEAPELEASKNYVWFFAPIAPGGTLEPDNYGITGWVKRVETPASARNAKTPLQLATEYASAGIWYDTIAVLAAALEAQPNNPMLASEWHDLLAQVGLKEMATEPIETSFAVESVY